MAEPITLDPLVELKLQKAFKKLDFKAVTDLFEAQERRAQDGDEASTAYDQQAEQAVQAVQALQGIHRLVKPYIDTKTAAEVLYLIWAHCKDAFKEEEKNA